MVETVSATSTQGAAKPISLNLILIGDGSVGKTALMKRYVNKKFDPNKAATVGVDWQIVKYTSRDKKTQCKVKIWDTAGQERFRQLTYSFFRDADGVIVTFDLTQHQTFINVRDWINSAFKYRDTALPFVLAGNKLDLCEDSEDGLRRSER